MAIDPLRRDQAPNKLARADAEFWALHDVWSWALAHGSATEREMAWRDLMAQGVASAEALLAKLRALRSMPAEYLDSPIGTGFTVRDVIEWDAERAAKREMFGLPQVRRES